MNFDIIIIGSGPGGYVAAIRASQLGKKVCVIEKSALGGICLNWGCIPAKSLLKSAEVYQYVKHAGDYGIEIEGEGKINFSKIIERSREVANGMSKGIEYLFKKNKIELVQGIGKLQKNRSIEVTDQDGKKSIYKGEHIIIATGASTKELPNLKPDGKKIIGYKQALSLQKQPESLIVVGSGAIGSELAHFYNSIGTQVTLIEILPNITPLEDEEISKQLERSFKKAKMKIKTSSSITDVNTDGKLCKLKLSTKKGEEELEADLILSAVGITPNLKGIGIEEAGIVIKNGKVDVDEYYRTNIEEIYAIGDIVQDPALAHVASAEGIICVEKIAGKSPTPLNYNNIPSCIYTSPAVASVGMSENAAKDAGYEIRVGKFPFSASGKASAAGQKDGFVKLIFDSKYGELLGAHMIGANVTEMIAEIVIARNLEITGPDMIKSIHPHPTMSEAIMEAAAAAYDEVIHL